MHYDDDDDDDDDALNSPCYSVSCSHRPLTLRPSTSFRSAPETPPSSPADDEKQCDEGATGSPESGSVVSPLRMFSGRGMARRGLVPHGSFNSYFRPAPVIRHRRPLSPPPMSPRKPEHSPLDQPSPSTDQRPTRINSVSSSPHRKYRKQVVRDASSSKWTTSTRDRAPRSPPFSGSGARGAVAIRRRSVYGHGHVTSGTGAAVPSQNLGRRNTVVGGGAVVECQSPPVPLSLREIYRLNRHGSVYGRRNVHAQRRSTFSILRPDKDGAWTSSRTSVVLARCESGRSRRFASSASQRASIGSGVLGDGDGDHAAAVDVRRRRSCTDGVEMKRRQSSDADRLHQSLHGRDSQDSTARDDSKTSSFDIILVTLLLAFAFINI